MSTIDIYNISYHVQIDRQDRFNLIEKTIGFGNPVVIAPDLKGKDATATLTDTGVIVIRDPYNLIITAWIASVPQAISVYRRATNKKNLPANLWNIVNYNNNTIAWRKYSEKKAA